jgi:hypothetical protein
MEAGFERFLMENGLKKAKRVIDLYKRYGFNKSR